MPRGNKPGSPNTRHLKWDAGLGRPKGAKNIITKEWVNKHLRWRVEFDPVAALFARHGKGHGAVWTLRDLGALSEQERMCLESYDIVKGNKRWCVETNAKCSTKALFGRDLRAKLQRLKSARPRHDGPREYRYQGVSLREQNNALLPGPPGPGPDLGRGGPGGPGNSAMYPPHGSSLTDVQSGHLSATCRSSVGSGVP
jgi:hypothetical protein